MTPRTTRKAHLHPGDLHGFSRLAIRLRRDNSGRHISTNGRELADRIEALLGNWPVPVEELAILGHSMGGLLARSAWHYGTAAGHAWPRHLK
ncbi:MAG: hypothetical protein FJY34_01875 [Betaproteobacteria bacterium]|nr:hypothetical protein [Betaproteobacteria bacterium]